MSLFKFSPRPRVSLRMLLKFIKQSNGAQFKAIKDYCIEEKLFFGPGETLLNVLLLQRANRKISYDPDTKIYKIVEK